VARTVVGMTPRLDAVGIVAADLDRSLDFYRRLGVDTPTGAGDQPHVEVALPGGLRLMWDPEATVESFDPGWKGSGGGRLALAFACTDAAEVDRTYAELTAAGYDGHLEPWDAFWGQRYASLRDPDGNGVDLFAPL
jgi:catechol 2,3-dioxygenase-like lactoylglutathione lyase family enzyme